MSPFKLLLDGEVYAPLPRGRCHLLVAHDRIVWMGPEAPTLPAVLGAEEIRLEGRRVIPGFVDGHVHLAGGGGEGGFGHRTPPVTAADLLRGGTTTVVGVLGTDDVTRSPAELVAAARRLAADGLTAFCLTGGYHLPAATITGSVTGDIMHIDPILGVGEIAVSDHRSSHPTTVDLVRVAGEAHLGGLLAGKPGLTHLHLGDGDSGLAPVRDAIESSDLPARVFQPTHVNRRRALFDEAIELAARGCNIDVTAFPVGPDEDAWSAADAVLRFLEADLPPERLTVSSDAGGSLPVFDDTGRLIDIEAASPAALAQTLTALLARGTALEHVLPAFTCNAARFLGIDDRGVLIPGAMADLVVLDADGGVKDVMARGNWRVRDGHFSEGPTR